MRTVRGVAHTDGISHQTKKHDNVLKIAITLLLS